MIIDKEPFVSVIIPNYCHARFLDERFQSVLGQTYQNFEVIILDDCSTDNSMEVINRYRNHPKVSKVVVNEKNSGSPFKQWQKGIALAKGEIIWIAESDDACESSFLETLVKLYQENGAVLAFCKSKRIDEMGNVLDNHFQDCLDKDFILHGKTFVHDYLADNNHLQNISSAVFSREAALRICDYYTSFRGAGDWIFNIELALQGNVIYTVKPLNSFRTHSENTTSAEYLNGHTLIERFHVFQFMLKNDIISTKEYSHLRKDVLRDVYFSKYDEETKKNLYEIWETKMNDMVWLKMLDVYNFLLLQKRRLF